MKKVLVAALLLLIPLTSGTGVYAKPGHDKVTVALQPVGGSGVSGAVMLRQVGTNGGTTITVHARGLMPGHRYRSLYYSNATCQIEPYSASDVIGGDYVANHDGRGRTRGHADDNLADIHSVSVRDASRPFSPSNPGQLLACARVTH